MRTLLALTLGLLLAAVPAQADILGQNGTGNNTRTLDNTYRCSTGTLPATTSTYSVKAYIEDTSGAGDSFRAVIFAGSDDSTVLAYSAVRTDISTVAEYEFTGGTLGTTLTSGTLIRICVGSNSAAGAVVRYPDSGIAGYLGTVNSITATPPTITGTLSADGAARSFIVFLDYTPDGGGGGGSTQKRRMMGLLP